jgi:hypothetical protein
MEHVFGRHRAPILQSYSTENSEEPKVASMITKKHFVVTELDSERKLRFNREPSFPSQPCDQTRHRGLISGTDGSPFRVFLRLFVAIPHVKLFVSP